MRIDLLGAIASRACERVQIDQAGSSRSRDGANICATTTSIVATVASSRPPREGRVRSGPGPRAPRGPLKLSRGESSERAIHEPVIIDGAKLIN